MIPGGEGAPMKSGARTPTLVCSKCGKEYKPGMKGWFGRVEGPREGILPESPLVRVLLCPDDYTKVPPAQRMGWHEFTGQTQGPTREKRPGRLGEGSEIPT
jgi:hypothetical protein